MSNYLMREQHAFVHGRFKAGERGGQMPNETCDVCGRDPRNMIHDVKRMTNDTEHNLMDEELLRAAGEHARLTKLNERAYVLPETIELARLASAAANEVIAARRQLAAVLRLTTEAEAAMGAGLAGMPAAPSVLCARLREAINGKIDPLEFPPRDRLLEIRERAQCNSRWIDDLEFLLKLAVDKDDPYEDRSSNPEALAARVQAMVIGNTWEDYLPRPPAPPREPRKRPAPIGPLTKVDVYECAEGHPGVRVEVERIPGSDDAKVEAHMEMERGAPTCPNCERDMIQVERKLRKTSK